MFKLNPTIAIIYLLVAFTTSTTAQNSTIVYSPKEFEPIKKVANTYRDYYAQFNSIIGSSNAPITQSFKLLFDDRLKEAPLIGIDFPNDLALNDITTEPYSLNDKLTLDGYLNRLNKLVQSNILTPNFEISNINRIYYCSKSENSDWYVYFMKKYTYKVNDKDTSLTTYSKLTLSPKTSNLSEYKITDIEVSLTPPRDKDHDYIIDECDNCPNKKLSKDEYIALTPGGCEEKSMRRPHPSSRFGLAISAGTISSLFNEQTDKDVINGDLYIKPGYFNKLGYSVDARGVYTFNSWAGVRFGCIFTKNSLNTKEIEKAIYDFLTQDSLFIPIYNPNFKFNNITRRLFIPHIDLSLGNFKDRKSIVSIEGTLGLAIPTFSTKDLIYQYDFYDFDGNYGGKMSDTVSFKAKSFPVYGCKLNYEFSPTKDGKGRFFIQVQYLTGKYDFPKPINIRPFSNNPNGNYPWVPHNIYFEGARIHLWGASLGFFYNIRVPKIKKEQDRFNASKTKN